MAPRLLSNLPFDINSRVPHFGDRRFRAALWLAVGSVPLDVARSLFWWVLRKRVRAWNILTRAASGNRAYYQKAIAAYEQQVALRLGDHPEGGANVPLTCVVFAHAADDEHSIQATLESIRASLGQGTPVTVAHQPDSHEQHADRPTVPAALGRIPPDVTQWVLSMRAGDRIGGHAGALLAAAVRGAGQAEIIYWDEDVLDGQDRKSPWFKPSWDPLLFLARDFLSGSSVCRAGAFSRACQRIADAGIEFDLGALAIALTADRPFPPAHLPFVLTHRQSEQSQDMATRQQWLDRLWPDEVRLSTGPNPFFAEIAFSDPAEWPTVSIIIPIRDRSDLLRSCLGGLARLSYAGSVEILIVDNGSRDSDTLRLLSSLSERDDVKIIRDDGDFNFSRLNNQAARLATGEFLCLLNNDVEPVDGRWLTEMVRFAVRPGTGAVGALLLYPDGSVQHAGVAVGLGGAAGHNQRCVSPHDPHSFSWHGVSRSVSVVTAACLLVRKTKYLNAGGLDEEDFPVAFNDVDLCLKLAQAGFTNVYVATAQLIHHESLSRGNDLAPTNRRRFERELGSLQSKWETGDMVDQYYHPAFSRSGEQCVPTL